MASHANPQPSPAPIRFRDRRTGEIHEEAVYGERWLRWTCETRPGRLTARALIKRPVFSAFYGWRMRRPSSRRLIAPFIEQYGLDPAEFAEPPGTYPHFDAFFTRKLRPGARPLANAAAVLPADGRHLGFDDISAASHVFVKGQRFDLPRLLGDAGLAARYAAGPAVLSRLCPTDYHRFHFPARGTPGDTLTLDGPLHSVSPLALRRRLSILWTNRRTLTRLATPHLGEVLLIEIGATCVGRIHQTFRAHRPVAAGDEKGCFAFGGSACLTLFEPGSLTLARDLTRAGNEGIELYAPMGDALGHTPNA